MAHNNLYDIHLVKSAYRLKVCVIRGVASLTGRWMVTPRPLHLVCAVGAYWSISNDIT